ncbi:hypothetical protein PsAD2_01685 [Pseudovibrio axinellae]|uniref:Leucine-binding protein domain-containing protein n=1 Tax=Pseudovibrio axinellae TaxID=989403 RepID=A0A165ZG64_9HYPH|nr:ABC transporter substrate-binding protein [Pseudovibrio axinellae]KZL19863.1 hypothetical protein PsAD2_01685 [Pseudovibrio axinellae]SER38836.1 amino acid/amide ABC transporter substrate-binding protein, HAAT family [Pseudovibrio axinellae]
MTFNAFKKVFVACTLALGTTTTALSDTRGVSEDEIIIGTHLDLSGPVAAAMPPLVAGIQTRLQEINEAGGIHGRKLRLLIEDNAYQPKQAVRAVQKMVTKDQAFLIFSPFGTGTSAAGYAFAQKFGVPHVFPWSGVPAIFHPKGTEGSFTYVEDYAWATGAGVDWIIKDKGFKRIGVLYQDDAFGKLVLAGVDEALKSNGLTLVESAGYKPGDVDFSAQIAKLKAADVDLVVLGTVIRETIGAYSSIRKVGWGVDVITTIPGRSQVVPLLGKSAMDGLYGVGQWNIPGTGNDSAAAQTWLAKFNEANPGVPAENAAIAYLMTDWLVQALEAAGPNLTVESFNTAFEGSKYQDIFGSPELTMTNGHISPEVASVWKVDGLGWVKVSDDITN